MKKLSSKEMTMIYSQQMENATQKRLHERKELKHFTRRITLILLLSVTVLVLLMLTFTPGVLENAVGPALQQAGHGIAIAKPVVKHAVVGAAKSITPALQQLVSSANAAINH
jgi:hypothetical protein